MSTTPTVPEITVSLSVKGTGIHPGRLEEVRTAIEKAVDRTIRRLAGPDDHITSEPIEMWRLPD